MLQSLFFRLGNGFYKLSNTKVVILGNQKSGTTAIAKLLAENTNRSVLLDSPLLWEPNLSNIIIGRLDLRQLINKNKYYFSREIIKEPNLTFLYDQLKGVYPKSVKYVFIVRDPRDNIRSILNRIKVSGNLDNIDVEQKRFTIHEKILFDSHVFNYTSDHYIEQLAERWLKATDVYFKSKDRFILVRYEDFKKDKIAFINKLALNLGIESKKDISTKVDIQYQPIGDHSLSWSDFFGKKNLDRINKICEERLQKLGYLIE